MKKRPTRYSLSPTKYSATASIIAAKKLSPAIFTKVTAHVLRQEESTDSLSSSRRGLRSKAECVAQFTPTPTVWDKTLRLGPQNGMQQIGPFTHAPPRPTDKAAATTCFFCKQSTKVHEVDTDEVGPPMPLGDISPMRNGRHGPVQHMQQLMQNQAEPTLSKAWTAVVHHFEEEAQRGADRAAVSAKDTFSLRSQSRHVTCHPQTYPQTIPPGLCPTLWTLPILWTAVSRVCTQ